MPGLINSNATAAPPVQTPNGVSGADPSGAGQQQQPPVQPGGQPGQPGQPQQDGQQAPQGPPLTEGPVDPDLLKKFEANCMNTVTGSLESIIKSVQQAQDKVAALAQATVFVVVRVEDSLEKSGGKLNLAMTFAGGAETVTDISDAMNKAGAYDYSQQEIDAAFLRAVDQYRMIRQQQGRLDPAMFQQIIQQMKQAQQDGTLDKQYPGLTDFAQKTAKDAQTGAAQTGQPTPPGQGQQGAGPQQDSGDGPIPEPGQNFPVNMLKGQQPGGRKSRRRKRKSKKGGV